MSEESAMLDGMRARLEACPRFSEHGLTGGCVLCDPKEVPDAVQRTVDEANAFGMSGQASEADAISEERRDASAPLGVSGDQASDVAPAVSGTELGEWVHQRNIEATLTTARELEAKNNETIKRLASQNIQVGNIDGLRMHVLLSMILDPMARATYELAVQETLELELAQAGAEAERLAARAKLTAPMPAQTGNGGRLILPPR